MEFVLTATIVVSSTKLSVGGGGLKSQQNKYKYDYYAIKQFLHPKQKNTCINRHKVMNSKNMQRFYLMVS